MGHTPPPCSNCGGKMAELITSWRCVDCGKMTPHTPDPKRQERRAKASSALMMRRRSD